MRLRQCGFSLGGEVTVRRHRLSLPALATLGHASLGQRRTGAMTFSFLHSTHQEKPILVPRIGLTLRVRVPPDTTGNMLTSIETINAPGFGPPLHRHRETEVFYVLEGRYLFEVDGKRFTADTGDVVAVPGGSAHAFVNLTDQPARQFIQILPGFDAAGFFVGLDDAMRSGKLDQDALNAFGRRWHVEFLGPPLKADRSNPHRH
jgi:quercetin dioxygenase-like cupin family protein